MAKKLPKTNAARLLDQASISYNIIPYEVDLSDLSAVHVAAELGEDVAQVFKTLVLRGDRNGIFVCVIPGDKEVNLKLAAKVSGNKSAHMIAMKELLPTTGYIRGACSPIGMKRQFPTFIDSTCVNFETIYISAGVRGAQIQIAPRQLVSYVDAHICDLTE